MILDRTIIGICQVASKESFRPALAAVKLEEKRAIATDGFMMLSVELPKTIAPADIPDTGHEILTNDTHLINAVELEKALKLIPTKGTLPILTHAWTAKGNGENSVRIISTNLSTTNSPEIMTTDATYPDADKVITELKEKEVKGRIRVDTKKLAQLLKAFITASGDVEPALIDIEIRGELDALYLTGTGVDKRVIEAILMPIRMPS